MYIGLDIYFLYDIFIFCIYKYIVCMIHIYHIYTLYIQIIYYIFYYNYILLKTIYTVCLNNKCRINRLINTDLWDSHVFDRLLKK